MPVPVTPFARHNNGSSHLFFVFFFWLFKPLLFLTLGRTVADPEDQI